MRSTPRGVLQQILVNVFAEEDLPLLRDSGIEIHPLFAHARHAPGLGDGTGPRNGDTSARSERRRRNVVLGNSRSGGGRN